MIGGWDFLTITVIAIAASSILTTYIREKYKKPNGKNEGKGNSVDTLTMGLVLSGVGLAILVGQYFKVVQGYWIVGGLVLLFIGLALISSYYLKKKKW